MRLHSTFALLIAFSSLATAQPKNVSTGLPFLKLGVGGRAVGMGEAYAALSEDASGIFYNPAGIAFGQKNEITLMHKQWIFGTSTEFIGATLHTGEVTLGFGFNTTNVDGIEIRQEPGPAQGTFGLHDLAISTTASWRIDSSFSIGITGKFIYEKIFVDESAGGAFDFGARYRFDPNLSFALAVSNLGGMNKLIDNPTRLPSGIRGGVSYSRPLSQDFLLTLAGDALKVLDDDGARIHGGGEILYENALALRAGYQIGYDAKGLSAGFGVHFGLLQLDYAFVPFLDQLGDTHTFALTFSL